MDQAQPEPPAEPPPINTPTSLAAPAAPTAEEWQLASTDTLKNSKRYRHNWGQQVRSQMGTAVAGPDQGQVRFRITINPNGSLAQVEELWSTSAKASEIARKAIQNMPTLPPAPEPEREERSPDCHPSDVEATFEEEDSELKRQIERNRWGR